MMDERIGLFAPLLPVAVLTEFSQVEWALAGLVRDSDRAYQVIETAIATYVSATSVRSRSRSVPLSSAWRSVQRQTITGAVPITGSALRPERCKVVRHR